MTSRLTSRRGPGRAAPAGAIALALLVSACGGSESKLAISPVTATIAGTTAPTTRARLSVTTLSGANAATVAAGTVPVVTGAWEPAAGSLVGLSSECGNLAFVASRPDRDELIVSVAKQGLWSAKGGSTTFGRLGQGGGSATVDNRGSQILFDPKNAEVFWESGIYGGGVFRTNDGGKTFQRLGSIENSDAMSIDFGDPARATMLSGKHEDSLLRRSTNGGATWTDLGGLPSGIGYVTYPLVLDSKTFLVGTQRSGEAGIFRSTDAGVSWTRVLSSDMNSPALVTADGIYWLTDNGALVRSTDQGVTWTMLKPPGFANPVAENMIRQMPDGRLFTLGRTVLVSADKGVNWSSVGPPFPYVPNGIAYSSFRNEFSIWRFDCDFTTSNPIRTDSIMKLVARAAG